jgi:uroporphyrinogen-III decarboxylase
MYREFYKPYHKRFNDWVHAHTGWKTFAHTCGSVIPLLEDFIEAGFDILNPVQFSAAGMDLAVLKAKYGSRIVFWGGGVNPQKTLPFGTPEEVARETRENVLLLAPGGGFVCGTVHNIQGPTPPESILAFFRAINET